MPGAGAPAWVAPEAQEGPEALAVGRVHLDDAARASVAAARRQAQARRRREERLYDDAEAFLQLVLASLTRDIRSVTQRQKVPRRRARGASAALDVAAAPGQEEGFWKILLDDVEIAYDVEPDASGGPPTVVVRGARAAR